MLHMKNKEWHEEKVPILRNGGLSEKLLKSLLLESVM